MATRKNTTKAKSKAKVVAKSKSSVKKAASKPAAKKVAKKAVAKKPAARKAAVKKPVAKKAAPKPAPKAAAKSSAKAAPKKPAPKPAAKATPKPAPKVTAVPKPAAPKPAPKKVAPPAPVKPIYKRKEFVVYPSHGVGQVTEIEEREVAGIKLALYVINFEKDKMTLRVPLAKAKSVGMRRVSPPDVIGNALHTLRGRARIKRTMWSRRAQEYEAKINSGNLISIAEVVRDLHRGEGQPEQSYSERQLYEAAIERMAREVAVANGLDVDAAMRKLEGELHQDAA